MIIANIELGKKEQYGLNTTRHGGGGIFGRYAKELLNNSKDEFWIFASLECYDNMSKDDNYNRCVILQDNQINALKTGYPLKILVPESERFDIVVHNQEGFAFNLDGIKAKQVCWLSFLNQTVHPLNDGCFVYSHDQNQKTYGKTKTYKIKIGSYVPENFIEIKKEPFIFVCTRHDTVMDTNGILNLCIKNNVKCIVAGPILDNYPLNIDNKNTFYIGEISNDTKNYLTSKSMLYSCVQNWDTIFSLSSIESLAYGTPILAKNKGCFKYILKNGQNGFIYNDTEGSFIDAINNIRAINPKSCWESSKEFSHIEMINSFYKAFQEILNDK